MELDCKIQNYEWGKLGLNSKVASLYKNANQSFEVNENKPYAELWMGTHPNGPSQVRNAEKSLLSVIKENPDYLGSKIIEKFGVDLPYLFKVLSVNKALSIQVHPSKKHAEELHAKRPDLYKDPNHKPELAIALTPFEALVGFRPVTEIKSFVKDIPELQNLIGTETTQKFLKSNNDNTDQLKVCFRALMCRSQNEVSSETKSILSRFSKQSKEINEAQLESLFRRLNDNYPNDIGCYAIYFLNVLELQPSEAMFLAANEPHAYLYGDCIECMACSDNVVRAGLTPKYKDVETLCEMLNYKGEDARNKIFKPVIEDEYCQAFRPPVPDFAVAKIDIPNGTKKYNLIKRTNGSIILCVSGQAKIDSIDLVPGKVLFIPANQEITVTDVSGNTLIFQAMANL